MKPRQSDTERQSGRMLACRRRRQRPQGGPRTRQGHIGQTSCQIAGVDHRERGDATHGHQRQSGAVGSQQQRRGNKDEKLTDEKGPHGRRSLFAIDCSHTDQNQPKRSAPGTAKKSASCAWRCSCGSFLDSGGSSRSVHQPKVPEVFAVFHFHTECALEPWLIGYPLRPRCHHDRDDRQSPCQDARYPLRPT